MMVLYHYCSTSTFTSIVNSKSIRLSSLSLSNDSMEGKLVSKIIDRILQEDGINGAIYEQVKEAFSLVEDTIDAVGICLSENGDLLSQWRGYADDAKGFSIGFSKKYLEKLCDSQKEPKGLNLYQVKYLDEEHEEAVRPLYNEIKDMIDEGKLEPPKIGQGLRNRAKIEEELKIYKDAIDSLIKRAFLSFEKMFTLKGEAFKEEIEWRLVSYISYAIKSKYEVRYTDNKLIPYKEFSLEDVGEQPISKVILGPKNITPINVVKIYLENLDFEGIDVSHSNATYR